MTTPDPETADRQLQIALELSYRDAELRRKRPRELEAALLSFQEAEVAHFANVSEATRKSIKTAEEDSDHRRRVQKIGPRIGVHILSFMAMAVRGAVHDCGCTKGRDAHDEFPFCRHLVCSEWWIVPKLALCFGKRLFRSFLYKHRDRPLVLSYRLKAVDVCGNQLTRKFHRVYYSRVLGDTGWRCNCYNDDRQAHFRQICDLLGMDTWIHAGIRTKEQIEAAAQRDLQRTKQ